MTLQVTRAELAGCAIPPEFWGDRLLREMREDRDAWQTAQAELARRDVFLPETEAFKRTRWEAFGLS